MNDDDRMVGVTPGLIKAGTSMAKKIAMFAMNLELYARPVRNLERYARSTLLVLCELYARPSIKSAFIQSRAPPVRLSASSSAPVHGLHPAYWRP